MVNYKYTINLNRHGKYFQKEQAYNLITQYMNIQETKENSNLIYDVVKNKDEYYELVKFHISTS